MKQTLSGWGRKVQKKPAFQNWKTNLCGLAEMIQTNPSLSMQFSKVMWSRRILRQKAKDYECNLGLSDFKASQSGKWFSHEAAEVRFRGFKLSNGNSERCISTAET